MNAHPHESTAARCEHDFLGEHHDRHERRTWWVVWLTSIMMVGEIIGGTIYGSMALVADGWHMSTHAAALTIAALRTLVRASSVRENRRVLIDVIDPE